MVGTASDRYSLTLSFSLFVRCLAFLMLCSQCGSTKTKVTDSRQVAGGRVVRRRIKCECGNRFSSLEIAVGANLHGAYAKDNPEGLAWDSLIAACLPRMSVNTLLNELRGRYHD